MKLKYFHNYEIEVYSLEQIINNEVKLENIKHPLPLFNDYLQNGYYPFGKISKPETIATWYYQIAKQAESNLQPTSFEILEHKADVKVMGSAILEDFSKALDKSLLLTKGFAIGSFIIFIGSLFL